MTGPSPRPTGEQVIDDRRAPVVEHVTGVIATDEPDGRIRLSRIDATIIGPRSIARPHALIKEPIVADASPDRPTREQVEAALFDADRSNCDEHDARILAAEVRALRIERDAALALHQDAGGGLGWNPPDGSDYGDYPTACRTCGTSDEYAVAWPCATARALGVES